MLRMASTTGAQKGHECAMIGASECADEGRHVVWVEVGPAERPHEGLGRDGSGGSTMDHRAYYAAVVRDPEGHTFEPT